MFVSDRYCTQKTHNDTYSGRRRGRVRRLLDAVERPLADCRVLPRVSRRTSLQVRRPAAQGVRTQLGSYQSFPLLLA